MNRLPALFKKIDWKPNTWNLDIGGGKYNQATKYLLERGVTNLIHDPFNRSREHNGRTLDAFTNIQADTVTLANVLCVIKEKQVRRAILNRAWAYLKSGGQLYISIYRGRGNKPGPTCNGWQNNRPLWTYVNEVEELFPDAHVWNGLIVATK